MTGSSGVTLALSAVTVLTVGAAALNSGPRTAAVIAAATPSGRSASADVPACPLTPAQERTAVDAFKKLLPVLTHPRCFNCHGGVNPYLEKDEGGHLGGKMKGPGDRGIPPIKQCQECHDGLPQWDTPLPANFFVGKSPRELCIHFKRTKFSGAEFVHHIQVDPFTKSAFLGDRALNASSKASVEDETGVPFANQRPPGNHAQFTALSQAWVDAMDAGWPVKPDCGCGPETKAWVGSVTTVFEVNLGPKSLGLLIETDSATVRFEMDSSFRSPARYWKATAGAIKWQTRAIGGACTGGGSGTVPIGLEAYHMAPAGLQLELENDSSRFERRGDGARAVRFMVGIGPWPDSWNVWIKYHCKGAPTLGRFSLFGASQWWGHPPAGGTISPDGKTMKGSHKTALGTGTIEWKWDLHLELAPVTP